MLQYYGVLVQVLGKIYQRERDLISEERTVAKFLEHSRDFGEAALKQATGVIETLKNRFFEMILASGHPEEHLDFLESFIEGYSSIEPESLK